MVLMPPGAAKSTYSSIIFPTWWFACHPASSVVAVSHTAGLGAHFGRQVRNLIRSQAPRLGFEIAADNRAAARWRTTAGGEYLVTGTRGAITGRRADLALIDDPIKSYAEANNIRLRDGLWNWFQSELMTRLKPGGRIILVMTRWHEDDIAGRLLLREPGQWHVLRLPALAEADDPLGREIGKPLWPEWEALGPLLRKRESVGERVWSATYQQAPRRLEGALFQTNRIEVLDELTPTITGQIVRAWDLAATAEDDGYNPDWTVGVKLLRESQGRFIVLDVTRKRAGPHQVLHVIKSVAVEDGPAVWIGLPEDPGQAGKSQSAYFNGQLAGYTIRTTRETGSKATRAMPVASQVEARNVAILRASWNHIFLEELRDFPNGGKDDQVDALSRAFNTLTNIGAPARTLNVRIMSR